MARRERTPPDVDLLYRKALTRIAELEGENHDLRGENHELQGKITLLASAGIEIRQQDSENLASYEATNKQLLEFAQEVADGRGKYARKARKLLGY